MVLYFLILLTAAVALYLRFIRPWQVRWGAIDGETDRSMAGDEVVTAPTLTATRAVTIQAHPDSIFPWIAQMGVTPRAGWYSIDPLNNLGKPSAEVILPELQSPHRGDLIPISPDGKQGLYIKDFALNQWMLWWNKAGDSTWVWGPYPIDETRTRLVTQVRMTNHWLSPMIVFDLLTEFTDIAMMRFRLSGIKRRAERLADKSAPLNDALT